MSTPNRPVQRSALALILLASCMLGACVGAPARTSDTMAAGHSALCQRGIVEDVHAVAVVPTGVRLTGGTTRDPAIVQRDPSEFDRIHGMTVSASQAIAALNLLADSSGHAGMVHMVRLQCGGVVYAFEPGLRTFAPGSVVIVEQGLIPRLRSD